MGTTFPHLPMLAIAVGLVSHAYSLSSLSPYVGFMVQFLGVTGNKDEAGYYAGYLCSAFMVGRFVSSYFWGRFADTYGRLPVLYIGLISIGVMSLSFGLSTNFLWALASRFLLGAMNGLVATAQCLISEICGKDHEVVGMGFVTGCWSFGLVIGPALGGLLAEPAKHYPSAFSESGLFGRYPYLLPNIVGALIAFSGLPLVFFFLKETAHLTTGIGNRRDGFEPLPTTETGGVETLEAGMEEGQSLEMTPLTQQISRDNSGSDNPDGSSQERSSSDAPNYSDGVGKESAVGCGNDTQAAAVAMGVTSGGSRSRDDSSGEVGRRKHDPARDDSRFFDSPLLTGEGPEGYTKKIHRSARGGTSIDEKTSGVVECLRIEEPGRSNTRSGNPDAGLDCCFGMDEEMATTATTTPTTTAAWREFLVPIRLLQEKRVRAILFVYGIYSFSIIGFEEVYPLWALSTVENGGLDWTTKQIGQVLSLCGVGMLTFQLLIYPWLSKRIGVTRSQRWACLLSIPVFLCFPFLSRMRDSDVPLVVGSVLLNFLSNVTATAVFINVALATNNAVDPSRRATLNGLSMTLGSLAMAGGPAFFSAIFAWSIDGGRRPFPLDYHLVFYLFALSMVAVCWSSWNVITDDRLPPTEPKASTSGGAAAADGSAEDPSHWRPKAESLVTSGCKESEADREIAGLPL